MSARIPHLLTRNGRHYARLVIPAPLRSLFNDKWELSAPLGADRREAVKRLPAAIADMQAQLEAATQLTKAQFKLKVQPKPGRPLTLRQLATAHYASELEKDDAERNWLPNVDPLTRRSEAEEVRPFHEKKLRAIVSGVASNEEADALIGWAIDDFRERGHLSAEFGTPEWREIARTLAAIQIEAINQKNLRDTGEFNKPAQHPLLAPTQPLPTDPLLARMLNADSAKTLSEVFPDYSKERSATPATNKECEVAIRMFEEFLGDAKPLYKIARADILGFKRALAEAPSNYTKRFPGMNLPEAIAANKKRKAPFSALTARTINNKYLSRIHSLLSWCVKGDLIPDNPASGVKVDAVKVGADRRKFFSIDDLRKIFPREMFTKPLGEFEWAMLISLYGGMRASELAQMKLTSIRRERDVLIFNVEEATKNAGSKRMVPVHSALLGNGLQKRIDELKVAGETHLFPDWYRKGMDAKQRAADNENGHSLNNYFPRFIPKRFNETYLPQVGVVEGSPYWHTFRHTFKTGLSLGGVVKSTRDYLCGHVDGSAGAVYVHDVSIATMKEAIEKLSFECFQSDGA